MARTIVPSPFQQEITLLANIKAKVDADGSASPLLAMFASKGISLVDDTATGVIAIGYDTVFKADRKSSQNYRQQGNALMKVIIKDTTGSFQFLKTLFDPNFKSVGDWGGEITDSGKFTYPKDNSGWMDWFNLMKTKNDSYISPAISPLLPYLTENNISLTNDATNGAAALAKQTSQDADKLSSEKARQDRDTKFNPVRKHIRAIIKFLKKLYPDNVKALGDYGITVVLASKVAKARVVKIKFGQSKLKVKLVLNSILSNTGTEGLNIYKGKTISGTPIPLAPGEKWITIKGYSTVCVGNASATNNAQFTILPK